jgi:orotidine-5'-phosphate decarboxylase
MSMLDRAEPEIASEHKMAGPLEAARRRLIVALDVPDVASATSLVDRLEGHCSWVKVGMELFTAAGPTVLEPILKRGFRVFLDLKFHDIPNTVAGAVRSAAALSVHMVTIHASGGLEMLSAARAALNGIANPPEVLAVTLLTSMDDPAMNAVGIARSAADQVELLARLGLRAGLRGFVCSPHETARVRQLTGPEGILVVPGIRPAGAVVADQRRISTPSEALREGATFLVVGRPITQAPDPGGSAEAIVREMAEGGSN